MPIKRKAAAQWKGSGKTGTGTVTSASKILNQTPYSYLSRFESGSGTNPEELVAAAHAGCFSMKLAFNLQEAGFTATEINTECEIVFDNGTVTNSNLTVKAKIPDITTEKFNELVKHAEVNCPISKLLRATISVAATLQ